MRALAALATLLPAVALAQAVPLPPPPLPPPPAGTRPVTATKPPVKANRLVVPDFTLAGSAHPDLARVLSDAAAQGAQAAPDAAVLSQSEIVAALGLDRMKQMLGCGDEVACLSRLTGATEANRVLAGSLTLLDRTALLSVKYVDVKEGRSLARATSTLVDPTEAELADAARRLAHEAVTGQKLDTTGTLRIKVDRPGAAVTLDGKALGDSPVAAVRLLEGPHSVVIQKKGFVRASQTVTVRAGQDAHVDVQLVPLALLGESARSRLWSWGWASAGLAAAGTVGGIVFGRMADAKYQDYKATTSRSRAVDLRDQTKFRATLANTSWGLAGAGAVAAGALLTTAAIQDARAARELADTTASVLPVPVPGGAMIAVGGRF